MPVESLVAKNIIRILHDRHLKHTKISASIGLSSRQFCDMLHSRRVITDIDVWNIACALGVTPNDLFQGVSKIQVSQK